MKLLILDNFFNLNYVIPLRISKNLNNFLQYYKKVRLNNLISKIYKKYKKNIDILIISNNSNKNQVKNGVNTQLLFDFRIDLERNEFLKIKKRVIDRSRRNIQILINNLKKIKDFQINGVRIENLIIYEIKDYFNNIFGEFELLKKIVNSDNYDKTIFINQNPKFIDFIKSLNYNNRNIEICRDRVIKHLSNIPNWSFFKFILETCVVSIREFVFDKFNKKERNHNLGKKNITFISNSRNQFNSIKTIYKSFKKNPHYYTILYQDNNKIPLNQINNLLKYSHLIKRAWFSNLEKISLNLSYNSVELRKILDDFYNLILKFLKIYIFNNFYHFDKFKNQNLPDIVVLADEMGPISRMYADICFKDQILTLYIPHGSLPIYDELPNKIDYDIIAVPGKFEKEYLENKYRTEKNVIVTGRPRYEKFYRGKIGIFNHVTDMFDNRIYNFDKKKFTILLATSPIDYRSREKQIILVINALKTLDLVDNLIIKLHPREEGLFHKGLIENLKVNPIIVRDYDILKLIKTCNLLLSRSSTTVLEAMIIGTPVIILDFLNSKFNISGRYLYYDDNLILKARDQQHLANEVEKLIKDKNFYNNYAEILQDQSKNYLLCKDKISATQIIINLIKNLLKEK